MKFIKIAAGAALALAMVGCGKDAASSADGAAASSTKSASAATSAAKAVVAKKVYEPKALAGTTIAVQYRKNTSPALKPLVDALVTGFKTSFSESFANSADEKDAAQAKKFYTDSGLESADIKWALVTVGGVSLADIEGDKVPDIAVAVAFDHDMDKIIAALVASLDEDEKKEIVETKVAGVKAWKVDNESAKADGAEPCFASLDGTLVLAATTPAVLERLVTLYKGGKGESSAFASLSSGNDAVLRVFVPALGELVKKATEGSETDLSAVDMLIPNGSNILLGLGDVDLSVLANASGASLKLAVNTATDSDAESLRTMLNAFVTSYVEGLKESTDEEDKFAYSALKDLKLGGEGKAFVVTMPIPDDLIKKSAEELSDLSGAFAD